MTKINPKIVLVGGGHSHAILLRLWGLQPLKNVDLTLITDVENTPYSGMLPGYLAGFYDFQQTHINLTDLAKFAGAKIIVDQAIALDLAQNRVQCLKTGDIDFDYLLIDIGSTPKLDPIPGIEYVIPAKPVPVLLQTWEKLLNQVKLNPELPINLTIVGGGIGGVELALNMRSRLANLLQKAGKSPENVKLTLIHRGERLLNNYSLKTSQLVTNLLRQNKILFYEQETIQEISQLLESSSYLETRGLNPLPVGSESNQTIIDQDNYQITCQSGLNFTTNAIFWVTQATPATWITKSGLHTDDRGFILIDSTLRSLSHPHIFATGDIASLVNHPSPKAGVFAVRQGQPLFVNLQKLIQGQALKSYYPQKNHLSLIGTGDKKAIAVWGNWAYQ
ncbi:MAG: FAD-dependent oxidoreductase, partial [Microcystaceae cyanobacterium]